MSRAPRGSQSDTTTRLGTLARSLANRRATWRILATLLFATAAWLLLERLKVSWQDILDAVARFDGRSLALAYAFVLLQIGMQAGRLRALFPRHPGMSLVAFGRAYFLGQAINIFLPGRAGDIVKIVRLAPASPGEASLSRTTGILVADKAVDVLAVGILLLAQAGELPRVVSVHRPLVFAAVGVAVLLVALLWLLRARSSWLHSVGRRFLAGLLVLAKPGRSLPSLACALLAWAFEIAAVQVLCRAVGASLSFPECTMAVLVLNLGILLPIAVANLGTFDVALTAALMHMGVPLAPAAAVAVVHHLAQLLGVLLWLLVLLPFRTAKRRYFLNRFFAKRSMRRSASSMFCVELA